MSRLGLDVKIRIVILMAKLESATAVRRALQQEKFTDIPVNSTITRIYEKFCETGSVEDIFHSGRPKKYDDNHAMKVEEILNEKPKSTLTEISSLTNISRSSVFRLIHSELNLKSYKIQIHQKLFEEDYDRRVQTAEELIPLLEDITLENHIFFSDEATFHVSGYVHTQNCRIWSSEKPTIVNEYEDNTEKVNVWCAMSSDCIIGPYFFDQNVNSNNYMEMLEGYFWPIIKRKRLASKIYFQQDGAPAHYSLIVRDWLNNKLPNRWIGRRGPIEWAARSPDLTPLDFFLWGYVKQKVYQHNIKSLNDLRETITNTINSINPDVLYNVFSEISKRMRLVIDNYGRHIEQFA